MGGRGVEQVVPPRHGDRQLPVDAGIGQAGAGPGAGSAPQPANAETGEDLVIDSADPEGPADQDVAGTPAAESAAPGVAAGSAPQPSDDAPEDGTANDK